MESMEYSQVFDIVKFEKAKAVASFNMFGRIAKPRQILEAVVLLGLISWSTARVPAAAKTAAGHVLRFSTYLFNHHVVFLIGNAIIVLLFVICRRNDATGPTAGDLYDDYVKHNEAASRCEPDPPPPCSTPDTAPRGPAAEDGSGDEEKRSVVCAEGTVAGDDVAAAIEKAERQIKRFQRTQSERLRREIRASRQTEFRRSESENRRKSVSSVDEFGESDMERFRKVRDHARPRVEFRQMESENRRKSVSYVDEFGTSDMERFRKARDHARARVVFRQMESENRRKSVSSVDEIDTMDMERLSSEDFRRTVDAFIDKHWSRKTTKQNQFEKYEKYHLLKLA